MTRGGKRDGAGRKAGSPNIKTAETAALIEESGLTPLEYMLTILRNEEAAVKDRMWAAEKAAPYVHAKLANVDVNAKLEGNLAVTFQTIYEKPPEGK